MINENKSEPKSGSSSMLQNIPVIDDNLKQNKNDTVFEFQNEDIEVEVPEKIVGTSYAILKELYDKCIVENTMQIFYDALDTTFSNPAILADSFRNIDTESVKDVYIDVDLDQIENVFKLILSNDKCHEQYDVSISKLITNLKSMASTITGTDILKAFMLPLYEYID